MIAILAVIMSIVMTPGPVGLSGAGLALIMLAIAVVDGKCFVVPDPLTACAVILGLVHAGLIAPEAPLEALALALLRGSLCALSFLAIREGYARLRGRQGLGLGDVKLATVAGLWLDWTMLPIAVELAALTALAVYVTRQFLLSRPICATNRIPFALFFAPAIWLSWLLQQALSGW